MDMSHKTNSGFSRSGLHAAMGRAKPSKKIGKLRGPANAFAQGGKQLRVGPGSAAVSRRAAGER